MTLASDIAALHEMVTRLHRAAAVQGIELARALSERDECIVERNLSYNERNRLIQEQEELVAMTQYPVGSGGDLAVNLPWRTGRKVGRTIYSQVGNEPSDKDPLIGVFDTPALAKAAVGDHNNALLGGYRLR